jgi:cell division septum initiation protein DivIVA
VVEIAEPSVVSQVASLLLATEATGFNAPITPRVRSLAAQTKMAEEKSGNAAAVGAAALAAALDVGLFEADLPSATIVALVAAYATTLNNGLGNAAVSAGEFAAGVYDKAVELNEQYEALPKAKKATDTLLNVADNINSNYGITDKIDEKLKLSPKIEELTEKIDGVKNQVKSTTDELAAATQPRGGDVKMTAEGETSEEASTLGAAAVGAALGVQVAGGLSSAVFLALLTAYVSTVDNGVGKATKNVGSLAANAYGKTIEFNKEYEVLGKAKSAADTVSTVADNVNRNYGITEKLEAKLGLSTKLEALSDKVSDLTGKAAAKAEELKEATKSRGGDVKMMAEGEANDQAVAVGAAALFATLDIGLFEADLPSAAIVALLAAYASTLDNALGDATKSAGRFASNVYGKAKELNEQYDLLPKAKSAADTVTTVADNVNSNYGLTDKLDEKLKLSEKISTVTEKIGDVKGKVTSTVDEISSAAKTPQ